MSSKLYHGDCLDVMKTLAPASVDMVMCDLPYGTTACKWDSIIPFAALWQAYERVVKPRGAIVLTCAQPFTAALVLSQPKWFRHVWVWDKVRPSGFQLAKHRPMMRHEDVCVFSKEPPRYFPQMKLRTTPVIGRVASKSDSSPLKKSDGKKRLYTFTYPQSILPPFCKPGSPFHPTQKPVALMVYLIRTYTREGDLVLDNCMGSGTTGEACFYTGRQFIGMEKDEKYFHYAQKRIKALEKQPPLSDFDFDSVTGVPAEISEEAAQQQGVIIDDEPEPKEQVTAMDEIWAAENS